MHNKGQITVFIIVGILVLAVMAGILFFIKSFGQEKIQSQGSSDIFNIGISVQKFVEHCVWKTAQEALDTIGEQGGYYTLPGVYNSAFQLPYYYYDTTTFLPDKTQVEQELSKYIDVMLPVCVDGFQSFIEQGYSIEYSIDEKSIDSTTALSLNSARFLVIFPLKVSRDAIVQEMSVFEVVIPTRFGTLLDVSKEIVLDAAAFPVLNLGKMHDLGNEHNLFIGVSNIENEAFFTLVDAKALGTQDIFDLNFIVQYKPNAPTQSAQSPIDAVLDQTKRFRLDPIPTLYASVGEKITHQITTPESKGTVTFVPLTNGGEIALDGQFSFVSQTAGEYTTTYVAEDESGTRDIGTITVVVE